MKSNATPTKEASSVAILQAEVEELKKQLAQAVEKNLWWEEQYKLARQRRFGKSSEKHIGQDDLFDEIEMPELEEGEEDKNKETITYTRKKKTKGRNIDTSKLSREICRHALSAEEQKCDCCGNDMHQIGEDKKEELIYIPATTKVIEHIYPKFACRPCEKIKSSKRDEGPIPKSMATSSLIAEIIISKYENHIPLYRRSKMFARDGIDIPDNTLGNWMMQACDVASSLG